MKLGRKIEDLEDVKFLMSVLQNVRFCSGSVLSCIGRGALLTRRYERTSLHCMLSQKDPCAAMQVREREADIDETIVPLEEMYGLLSRYEVRKLLGTIQRASDSQAAQGGGAYAFRFR